MIGPDENLADPDAHWLKQAFPDLTFCYRSNTVSLTHGRTRGSRLVSWVWSQIYVRPTLVGGCRPIELLTYLSQDDWQIVYNNVVVAFGVPSEIAIACPRAHLV